MLAEATPASFVAFDLLALGDRRPAERALLGAPRPARGSPRPTATPPVHLTPSTTDPAVATDWFSRFEGAGLDGVVAKRPDLTYREGERVMAKVKHERTADCAVAGLPLAQVRRSGGVSAPRPLRRRRRPPSRRGLRLVHRGATAGAGRRARPVPPDDARGPSLGGVGGARSTTQTGRARKPGAPSRWNAGKDLQLGAARPGSGVRGGLRPPPRRPLPSRHHVPALAARPAAPSRAPTPSSRWSCRPSSSQSSGPDARRLRRVGCRDRLGAARCGSPFCLGKFGGHGASPRPSASSR